MTIPIETRRLYVECRDIANHRTAHGLKLPGDCRRLSALCDAIQAMTARALEAGHNNECIDECYPLRRDSSTGEATCLRGSWDNIHWLAEADRWLRDLEKTDG